MKKKEYIFLGIISLLLVSVGAFFIYFKKIPLNLPLEKNTRQNLEQKGIGEDKNDSVQISLLTEKGSVKVDAVFEVEIFIDTINNNINGADISLKFNPYDLEVVDSEPNKPGVQVIAGEMFDKPMVLQNIADNAQGEANLSIGSLTPFSGKGVYGIIRFRTLQESSSEINFNSQKTKIAILDETKNYLIEQKFKPLEIKITN